MASSSVAIREAVPYRIFREVHSEVRTVLDYFLSTIPYPAKSRGAFLLFCAIKIHDIESGKRVWMLLQAHEHTPISAVVVTGENQWATGDEKGLVKLWDKRQPGPGLTIKREDENPTNPAFNTINDLAVGNRDKKWLYAATDDGSLAVYNLRRRRLDMVSDTLGYSARSVAVIHVSTAFCIQHLPFLSVDDFRMTVMSLWAPKKEYFANSMLMSTKRVQNGSL
ncbi:unnamed protein product [Echinostoma caproni]|uniref:WD_REPEATS_REGION domain-containing protein n=1 Tax=Echinostoma caproni TaxID=27848 RepID=A0A183AKQ5_9TREM|nr:unnamed protein product [Echinostoma caproni]